MELAKRETERDRNASLSTDNDVFGFGPAAGGDAGGEENQRTYKFALLNENLLGHRTR